MDIKITMLNVGDGDSIIVLLKKSSTDQLLILIDGGHVKDAPKIIKALNEEAESAKKKGPDLIICSHFDADHIGGLKKVVENFAGDIKQVWMHTPGIILDAMKLASEIRSGSFNSDNKPNEKIELKNLLEEGSLDSKLVIESYDQMAEMVEILKARRIPIIEPFNGHSYPGWPEIKVLGPTRKFYDKCLKKIVKPDRILLDEIRMRKNTKLLLEKSNLKLSEMARALTNPCETLDDQEKDHVTEVNQISIILEITVSKNKFLFTGDASIESFEAIPDYKNALKNIYWLKVAHHGSHNNSSSELFDLMTPKFADISGGNRYLDDEVRDCLKTKKTTVRTTRDEGTNLTFPFKKNESI